MTLISAQDLQARIESGAPLKILDVRTPVEHNYMRLAYLHEHLPLHEIELADLARAIDISQPLYILCKAGPRALQLAYALMREGAENVHVVEGGLNACQAAGMEMESTVEGRAAQEIDEQMLQDAAKRSYQAFLERYAT